MNVKDEWSMACPKCGDDDQIIIQATAYVRLTVDGTEEAAGHEWDGGSICLCGSCGHVATVCDFYLDEQKAEREKEQ
jgi:hypothetical protein